MKMTKKLLIVLSLIIGRGAFAQFGPPPPPGVPLGTNEFLLIAVAIVLLYFFVIRSGKNITRP